jgi:M6 family metalloprotease-like protein
MKLAPVLLVTTLGLLPTVAFSQIVPPKPGVEMPQVYFDAVKKDKKAFRLEKAWIGKAKRAKKARKAFLDRSSSHSSRMSFETLATDVRREIGISGTFQVPVIMIKYSNTGADPYPVSDLQAQLFDGPNPNGTMTDLYDEMSYGNLTMTGTVVGWVQAANPDLYYEGAPGDNGLHFCRSKTGRLIQEALQVADIAVDFGIYDNDGADGIPNSGDDDGFVDFVAIVQPEIGGECGAGGSNMWSHRWVVGGWPEFGAVYSTDGQCDQLQMGNPWMTNDASAGGGNVLISDYTLQPAKGSVDGCGTGVIEIGVFSHEFGHAFGLPDLYDTDGGGQGIGHFGLMGSGNWNQPTNPAHMSAWSKIELGWISPTEAGSVPQAYTINNVEQNAQAYQLNVVDEKFARSNLNPIGGGGWSMHCGISATDAGNRNWAGGAGYGNGWRETIERWFSYNGSGSVTLQFDASYGLETGRDFGRIKIGVNGTETVLRTYSGSDVSAGVVVDITPHLSGSGATTYRIIAEMTSDFSWSDEDGVVESGTGGPFKLDNVSVTGGGENYFTDFEQHEDGWYYSPTPSEYYLVENRNKSGRFDQFLASTGLYIWHIEQNAARSSGPNTGGTRGTTNLRPAAVTLMDADGLWDLLNGRNRGDAGDAFPGTSNNRAFNNSTTPDSRSHSNLATLVTVTGIGDPGSQMTATMSGGHVPPTISSITPTSGARNSVTPIPDLTGGSFVHGATFMLRGALSNEYPATNVRWIGKGKLTGELALDPLVPPGFYDVVVQNPDGREAVLSGGFKVTDPGPVSVQDFSGTVTGLTVALSWQITEPDSSQGFRIYRKVSGDLIETLISGAQPLPNTETTFEDTDVQVSMTYRYSLAVVLKDDSELRSEPIELTTTRYPLQLLQNVPNPFNPTTVIGFSLPTESFVSLNIFDVKGRLVTTLVNEVRPLGPHQETWDGTDSRGGRVTSGVYFYRLRSGGQALSKKLMLLR